MVGTRVKLSTTKLKYKTKKKIKVKHRETLIAWPIANMILIANLTPIVPIRKIPSHIQHLWTKLYLGEKIYI